MESNHSAIKSWLYRSHRRCRRLKLPVWQLKISRLGFIGNVLTKQAIDRKYRICLLRYIAFVRMTRRTKKLLVSVGGIRCLDWPSTTPSVTISIIGPHLYVWHLHLISIRNRDPNQSNRTTIVIESEWKLPLDDWAPDLQLQLRKNELKWLLVLG